MTNSPRWPDYEIPNPQVQSHARQIADAAAFLYQHMPEVNCVPSVLLEGALAIELYLKSLSSKTVSHPLEGIPGVRLLRDALARFSNLFVEIRYDFESREGGGNSITD